MIRTLGVINSQNFRFSREWKALYMRNSKETLELHRPRDVTFMYRIVLLFENMFVQNFEHLLLIDSLKLWFSKCTECMKNGRPSKVLLLKKKKNQPCFSGYNQTVFQEIWEQLQDFYSTFKKLKNFLNSFFTIFLTKKNRNLL